MLQMLTQAERDQTMYPDGQELQAVKPPSET